MVGIQPQQNTGSCITCYMLQEFQGTRLMLPKPVFCHSQFASVIGGVDLDQVPLVSAVQLCQVCAT